MAGHADQADIPVSDPIIDTFELAAERHGDITQAVYRRYYQRSDQAARLMNHVDQHMQGRMMEEVLTLLMTAPVELPEHYLNFETRNHAAYGVAPELYRPLFEAVRDVVRDALGDDWSAAFEAAWEQRVGELDGHIRALAPGAATLAGGA